LVFKEEIDGLKSTLTVSDKIAEFYRKIRTKQLSEKLVERVLMNAMIQICRNLSVEDGVMMRCENNNVVVTTFPDI
jgi:hypothetical protein